ncbi:MAG: hypothetical protein ACP6IY_15810 [Promethearchaeia archaeon]
MNIWIMDSESGITLLYKAHMDFDVNEDLISGLLTALNQFSSIEFKQPIESIDMGGLRWVYLSHPESKLLFIAADTKDVDANIISARLNVIKQTFIKEYQMYDSSWRKTWNGNIEKFQSFKKVIEEFYMQWKQVAKVQNIAEFYDILLVFQQILNLLMDVIEGHFAIEIKEKIYSRIEDMFENYLNHQYVKANPELQKISFNRRDGFNIIDINPQNCDMIVVEKQIINLIKRVVNIIKFYAGPANSIKFFIEENIFKYILSNFNLLKALNLDQFLLQVFLEDSS